MAAFVDENLLQSHMGASLHGSAAGEGVQILLSCMRRMKLLSASLGMALLLTYVVYMLSWCSQLIAAMIKETWPGTGRSSMTVCATRSR